MDVVSIGETMALFTPDQRGPMRYARNFSLKMAGAETNTLIGLAKLGHKTGWISRVGKDEFGAFLLHSIRGEGVDTSRITVDDQALTGIFFKEIRNEKDVRITYYRKHSAASRIRPEQIDEDYIASARFLYLTGITPALSESCRKAIFYSMDVAKKHGVKIVFDPNLRLKLWSKKEARKTLLSMAEMADLVLPGYQEGIFLTETTDIKEMADVFHQLGNEIVIIKCGEKGAYYSLHNQSGFIHSFPVKKVIDPVGAGDGFAAGVLSGLLDGLSISQSVERGCAIGAMVTTVPGDIEGLPDRETLEAFLKSVDQEDIER